MADNEFEPKASFGQMIDSIGVKGPTLQNDDMVTDVVVITKIMDADGHIRLNTSCNAGISVFEMLGMMRAAMLGEENSFRQIPRGED